MKFQGSLQNRMLEGTIYTAPNPRDIYFEGQGVTECLWSDCHAYYIFTVDKFDKKGWPKEITVIRPAVKCKDWYAGDWEIESFEDTRTRACEKRLMKLRRTRKGTWTRTGRAKDIVFHIGSAREYQDPSF